MRGAALFGAVSAMLVLAACGGLKSEPPARSDPTLARALIEQSLPPALADRPGWAEDLYVAFAAHSIAVDRAHVCAAAAVIQQESGFRVNPVIPGLPAIAWREIGARADRVRVPMGLVRGALALDSRDGRTYAARIDAARTEKDLSDIFEDMTAAVPLGTRLFADKNPIRTRGPMQVNVSFVRRPGVAEHYPYPIQGSLEDELFTRRGGLYFGVAHLLDYRAPYDSMIYRFADFNAGQYASRNAAFQSAIGLASGSALTPDGALLPSDSQQKGATERALDMLADRLESGESALHDILEKGRSQDLENTAAYAKVFVLAESRAHHPLPRAVLPRIELHGPKITRPLTTAWYARRVNARYEACYRSVSS